MLCIVRFLIIILALYSNVEKVNAILQNLLFINANSSTIVQFQIDVFLQSLAQVVMFQYYKCHCTTEASN
jgi:hypothetical protein